MLLRCFSCMSFIIWLLQSLFSEFVGGISEKFGRGSEMLHWLCMSRSCKKENIAKFSHFDLDIHLFAWPLAQESP